MNFWYRSLPICLLIMIGFNMRSALTSVPPILTDLKTALELPSWLLGSLTTIPLLCFALLSPFVPRLYQHFKLLPVLFAAMAILGLGTWLRIYNFTTLIVGTLLLGCAIAFLNVLAPTTVAVYYPASLGKMTSIYTLAMTLSSAAIAGFSALLAKMLGWRSLFCWLVLLPLVALLIIAALGRIHPEPATAVVSQPATKPKQVASVWHQPLAWALTFFMGLQSLLFYTILTWLPQILSDQGRSQASAGLFLGLLQLASLPMSVIMPNLVGRRTKQAPLIWLIFALFIGGFICLLVSESIWSQALSCILLGLGTNAAFTMSMTLFSLKTKTPAQTTAVSGMAQSVGYLLAATGPFLSGVLYAQLHSWTLVIILLMIIVLLQTLCGLLIDRKEQVFD